ncbi:hypothetical protein BC833DRAFT_592656 [Globomyces pollinis-pini]|nr:hypothetical protein BC833DRAFT_592656 [Globomyces pollinis-pini]
MNQINVKNLKEFNLQPVMIEKLCLLNDQDIIIVCDDSTFMNTPVVDSYYQSQNRWLDMKEIVSSLWKLLDSIGHPNIQIQFINRPGQILNDLKQLDTIFNSNPIGYNLLTQLIDKIFLDRSRKESNQKQLLLIILTCGDSTIMDTKIIKDLFKYKRDQSTSISMVNCGMDDSTIKMFFRWNHKQERFHFTDTYSSQKKLIRRFQGPGFPFTHGDWISHILLSAIDPIIATLHHKKVKLYPSQSKKLSFSIIFIAVIGVIVFFNFFPNFVPAFLSNDEL